MTCHGELAKSRPHVKYLTLFYLMVAAGGALGGLFVVLVAPYLFPKYWELHIGIVAALVMTLVSYYADRRWYHSRVYPRLLCPLFVVFTVVLSGALALEAVDLDYYAKANWKRLARVFTTSSSTEKFQENVNTLWEGLKDVPENDDLVERTRTFYGILSVEKEWDEYGEYYSLNHGRIQHGIQYQPDDMRNAKTSYYSAESGFGLAVEMHPNRIGFDGVYRPMHIGVIGLGTGSTAVYGRQGDRVRYYDINPEVARIAYEHFSYCKDSAAGVTVVLGDARVKLEQELAAGQSQKFDVLAVDAFSSDAIPMHLLTRESFKLYWEHLKDDGILAVHISNRYLDLSPVVCSLAEEVGKKPLVIEFDNPEDDASMSASTWILVTTNKEFYDSNDIRFYTGELPSKKLIWTDDFGSLRQVLRRDE